jgi:histone deacetylase 1/2
MDNANTKEYLDKIRSQVIENLRRTGFAPSVQMTDVPRDPLIDGLDDEADAIMDDLDEDENKDKRFTKRRFDQYIEKTGELSDSEDEEELSAIGVHRQPGVVRRRNHISHRNLDVTDSGLDSGIATPREASALPDQDEDMDLTTDAVAEKIEASLAPEAESRQSPSDIDTASKIEEKVATEADDTAPATTTRAESPASALSDAHSDVDMEDINATAAEAEPASVGESVGQEKTPPASPPAPTTTQEAESPATSPRPAAPVEAPIAEEAETKEGDKIAEEPKEEKAAVETSTKSEDVAEEKPASEPKEPEKNEA